MASSGTTIEEKLIQPNVNFSPQLDFMRSLAVLLVVIDHTSLALGVPPDRRFSLAAMGAAGVWFFFVHTSLVLMWSLDRKPYTLDFYVRRIFRIYPLAILATCVVLLTHAPLSGGYVPYFNQPPHDHFNALNNFFLTFNLFPYHSSSSAILHVEWSLPLEVDMYLFLPVLFAFARREKTIWTLALMWLLCTRLCYASNPASDAFARSIPHFLAGVMAFVGFKLRKPLFPAWTFVPFMGVIAIGSAFLIHSVDGWLPWLTTLLIGLSLPYFQAMRHSGFTEVCNQLAKYSYGIYLAHPFAILLGVRLFHHYPVAVQLGVEALAILLIAVPGYHLIEKPMIRLGARVAARIEVYWLSHNGGSRATL